MKGLIVKRVLYGESDLVLKVLLEDSSLVSYFAAGARRSKKRFPHQFDLTGLYQFESLAGTSLMRLQSADLIDWRPELARDLETWARWSLILEWVAGDEAATPSLLSLLKIRDAMAQSPLAGVMAYHQFWLERMQTHGIRISIDECAICHKLLGLPAHFVLGHMGLTHERCARGIKLSVETVEFLSSDRATRPFLKDPSPQLISELDSLSLPYLSQALGRSLKAQDVFWQLRRPNLPVVADPEPESVVSRSAPHWR